MPGAAHAAFGHNPGGFYNDSPDAIPIDPNAKKPPKQKKDEPVTLEADEMGYDQDDAIVIARGHVSVVQGTYVLTADQITYYQNTDIVIADGNVSMLQPTGDVYFSDHAKLTDNMKRAVIDTFRGRMSDNSVMVATRAVKVNPSVTKMTDASYTPCNVCAAMAPFWQLDADHVKVDEGTERVTYHDVDMKLGGVPVFYSPYFSHPTPDAGAKSGFLSPDYKAGGTLGSQIRTPYYWRIDDDKDLLLTPWYTTLEGPLLQGDYREVTDGGNYRIQGSITDPSKLDSAGNEVAGNAIRGAIFAKGEEKVTDESVVGFDIQRATDDTYLRRYDLGSQTYLFSRAYAESSEERNFAQVQGLWLQGLQATDNSKTTPLVLPMFEGYYETPADDNNIRYHVSGDAQSLTRDVGVDQRRISTTLGASHPYVSDGGNIFTTTLNLRQDFYNSDHVPINGGLDEFSGSTLRTLPQAALQWELPLINQLNSGSITLSPIILAVAQTNGGNPDTISNEDNQLIELSDTNLFSLDRMPGLDTVDSGSRVAYGFRGQYLMTSNMSFDALFGQNYNFSDSPFNYATTTTTTTTNAVTTSATTTIPGNHFSDYIGRIGANYAPFTFAYRFALDNEDLSTTRSEFSLGFAKPWFTIVTGYDLLDKSAYVSNSKEGTVDMTLPFNREWSIYGGARRDFDLGQMVSANTGIIYKNECFNIMLEGLRSYARDRDVEPSTQVLLRVAFKNLGEVGGQ